jgi:hypothetical protein
VRWLFECHAVGHLDALHPLSRTLAAIGFALAACRIRVSVDRQARGALTVREWLALKPIVVVVLTKKGAFELGYWLLECRDACDSGGHYLKEREVDPNDMLMRSNLMAKAQSALRRGYKRLYDGNLQPMSNRCTKIWTSSSGDVVNEGTATRIVFRCRQTIRR